MAPTSALREREPIPAVLCELSDLTGASSARARREPQASVRDCPPTVPREPASRLPGAICHEGDQASEGGCSTSPACLCKLITLPRYIRRSESAC